MVRPALLLFLGAPLLASCGKDTPEAGPDASWEGHDPVSLPTMTPAQILSRTSLDLRGVRPSVEELDRLEADEGQLDVIIDEYLDDPRFGARLMELYSEIYLTEADTFVYLSADSFGIDSTPAFLEAVGQEPLRILERVANEDLPYTELVTADWTMANETLAQMWPVSYPDGAEGWQPATYTDARPAAGVLSTSSMWLRYTSTSSNLNRKRANQVSRIFLCNDYLTRAIEFDRDLDLLDSAAIEDAVKNDPACVNCHNSLDPLAAYFFGFWTYQNQSYAEVASYHPDRERLWDDALGVSPAFYGDPGDSLDDLGRQLAGDPRFVECAVEQAYTLLLDREVEAGDMGALTGHREAFLAGGLTLEALYRSVVADPRYRAGDHEDADAVGGVPLKMASNGLLASQIEGLTGFRWEYADYDMMKNDIIGVRTLAGGADGYTVTRNADAPNATLLLVQERLAESAAYYSIVSEHELPASERTLWTEVDFTETPDTDREAIVAQLQHLHLAVFGERVEADGEEIAANLELWEAVHTIEGDPAYAWWAVASALLRDPDFLLY